MLSDTDFFLWLLIILLFLGAIVSMYGIYYFEYKKAGAMWWIKKRYNGGKFQEIMDWIEWDKW